MDSPVTGTRVGATTKVSCLDCAAMFAASLLRKNKTARIIPFANDVKTQFIGTLNGRDSIVTNAIKLTEMGRGGTDCSAPLAWLNSQDANSDVIIYISDYESWADKGYGLSTTGMMSEWNKYKNNNPNAKLICMDLTPRTNSQVKEYKDILQIGGWSDQGFNVIADFIEHGQDKNFWVSEIEKISLSGDSKTFVKIEEFVEEF